MLIFALKRALTVRKQMKLIMSNDMEMTIQASLNGPQVKNVSGLYHERAI